jgi:hypothetical protein
MHHTARFDMNVENMKRRGALLPMYSLDMNSRVFFDRVLTVRKVREFVFITKANAKGR